MGRTFGVWRAIEPLGKGGMGQVYLAERADGQFEKQVALKVIKSGAFSDFSQQRFLTEMRILAQFEHPNIAHLIDGGTNDEGIVYFVMELVIGEPIIKYVEAHKSSLFERINLVLQVIDAVEYAHQNLIIHGDIKPANVLVNQAGQVKLVDFGIARSIDDEAAEIQLPQFTPSYSAPEQASGQGLSTASDVFGICAVLYEMCSGSSPRDTAAITSQMQYADTIKSPIQSVHKKFLQNNPQGTTSSIHSVGQFGQALGGELGSIIDKGLQIAVLDRYRNTAELRRDLKLFLTGSAVPTYKNTKSYRWRKTLFKYKWPVMFSSLALVMIIVTAVVAINQAQKAREAADKANWVNQFLMGIFTAADPIKNQIKPITVNELTALAAKKIMQDGSNNELKTNAMALLSQIQHKLGEVDSSKQLITEQIRVLKSTSGNSLQLAAAHIEAGLIALTMNDFEQSSYHYQQAMLMAPLSRDADEHALKAAIGMADSLIRLDQSIKAEPIIEQLKQHQSQLSEFEDDAMLRTQLFTLYAKFASSQLNYQQALQDILTAKTHAKQITDNALLFPEVLGIEADIYFSQGMGLKAEQIDRQLVSYYIEKFGEDHPKTIDSLSNLAVSLLSLGKINETIEINNQLIDILKTHEITDHQEAASYLNLGIAYDILGEYHVALSHLKLAQAMWPTLTPRYLYYDALTYVSMARSYLALNQYDLAAQYFQLGLTTMAQEVGKDHHRYAWFEVKYTALLIALDKVTEAEEILRNAREIIASVYGDHGKRTVLTDLQLAQVAAAQGHDELAKQLARKTLVVFDVPHIKNRYPAEIALAKKIIKR